MADIIYEGHPIDKLLNGIFMGYKRWRQCNVRNEAGVSSVDEFTVSFGAVP